MAKRKRRKPPSLPDPTKVYCYHLLGIQRADLDQKVECLISWCKEIKDLQSYYMTGEYFVKVHKQTDGSYEQVGYELYERRVE